MALELSGSSRVPWDPPALHPGMLGGGRTDMTHIEHWRGRRKGHPTVPGVPAPLPSLAGRGRAQAGRGPGLPPKKLLLLAGRVPAGRAHPAMGPGVKGGGGGEHGLCSLILHPPPNCSHPPARERSKHPPPQPPSLGIPSPPHSAPWKGQRGGVGTQGGTQGGVQMPPPNKSGMQHPWETAPSPSGGTWCPSPAEKGNSSHQWRSRGRPREGSSTHRGEEGEGERGLRPIPEPRLVAGRERGRIRGPRWVFPAPVPAQEAPERPRLRPRDELRGRGGGGHTLGDTGTRPSARRLIAFQHHPRRGHKRAVWGPHCPQGHPPWGLTWIPKGRVWGAALLCWGPRPIPAAGGTLAAPQPRGGWGGGIDGAAGPPACRTIVRHFPPSPRD